MTQTSDPRPPMSPGDWSALGLRSGRCFVGRVEYVTTEAVHLRFASALTGELMDEFAVVQWADVGRYVVVPASAAETDDHGYTVVPIDDLWHLQTTWQARGKDRRCPACTALAAYDIESDRFFHLDGSANDPCWLALHRGAGDGHDGHEVRLISGTSGRTYPWTVTRKPITETAAEHGIDLRGPAKGEDR